MSILNHSMRLPVPTLAAIGAQKGNRSLIESVFNEWMALPEEDKYHPFVLKVDKLNNKSWGLILDFSEDNWRIFEQVHTIAKNKGVKPNKVFQYVLIKHFTPNLIYLIDDEVN